MEDFVIYIVIIAISGIISIANKAKEKEQKRKKENNPSPEEYQPPKQHEEVDCPFCGALNDKTSRYCLICGFDILNFSAEEQEKEREKIKTKADLIAKREKAIIKRESENFNKRKSSNSQVKQETVKSKRNQPSQMDIKQIFLYKELLDKPLAMRNKQ